MKYLQKSFSVGATEAYANAFEATFGEQPKACGWCNGTGRVRDMFHPLDAMGEPCPKGCQPRPSRGRR